VNPGEVSGLFERYGVLHTGHFKLSSGRHSDTYLQCARILEHPRVTASLGEAIAKRFADGPDVVVSPAMGGILIGNAVAYSLGVRFLFTERVDGTMKLRRGQKLVSGERALIVEDVITTGGSAAEVLALCEREGATVIGVGSLVDRSEQAPSFHLEALLKVKAKSWEPSDCPMCARGESLDTPGSRELSNPSSGDGPSR
jgi:orotate phosphoribosyltransferase